MEFCHVFLQTENFGGSGIYVTKALAFGIPVRPAAVFACAPTRPPWVLAVLRNFPVHSGRIIPVFPAFFQILFSACDLTSPSSIVIVSVLALSTHSPFSQEPAAA